MSNGMYFALDPCIQLRIKDFHKHNELNDVQKNCFLTHCKTNLARGEKTIFPAGDGVDWLVTYHEFDGKTGYVDIDEMPVEKKAWWKALFSKHAGPLTAVVIAATGAAIKLWSGN